VIFPYIGGKEVNDSPTHAHHRYVINFGDRSEEECRREWLELMGIVERKVKPDRMKNNREGYKHYWWQYAEKRGELSEILSSIERVVAISRVGNSIAYVFANPRAVFAESIVLFPFELFAYIPVLQGRIHEWWARFFASSMKDDVRYSPSDCFETFPFPSALLDSAASDPAYEATRQTLEAIGERYHQFRADLMVANNEGLTSTYNRFHDPAETSEGILELRGLHSEMDQAVLAAYGWSDVSTTCGFGLDYLDSDDIDTLPPDLQERIGSGDLFFPSAAEACNFQAQLRHHGVVKANKKLPWRHRWPDAVRDEVLARLLALNAERYAEEVAQGLHSKGAKAGKAGRAGATAAAVAQGAKRRGRPSKASRAGETETNQTEQMGLGL
jgi:hypothetical protein